MFLSQNYYGMELGSMAYERSPVISAARSAKAASIDRVDTESPHWLSVEHTH